MPKQAVVDARQLPLRFEYRANLTFQDYFPGTNLELVTHLQQCVAGTGEPFIYLWGQPGQGKSHLLQSCCREAQLSKLSSFYFDFEYVTTVDSDLFNGLEECVLVCFDNIEQLAGHSEMEQAFFAFFNQHRDRGHRLIVSADRAPNALPIRLPDLKTRLNWGLSLKIQALSENERIAALRLKAKRMGLDLSPQAGRYLLSHTRRDLASLWSLLEKLDQASLSAQRKLTIPFLKEILNNGDHG